MTGNREMSEERGVSVGQVVFGLTMVGLGIAGAVKGEFAAIWEPVGKSVPGREVLVYLCAVILVICGAGLLWRKTAGWAARVLLGYLLIWFLVFKVPAVFRAPKSLDPWFGCGETAVIVAGTWVLYAWFGTEWNKQRLSFASGKSGVRIARVLYGLAMIPFGVGHFIYLKETAALVPRWLPWHLGWVYATGSAFFLAGVAVLSGVLAKWAAALSALQVGLFTVLVWVPIAAAGSKNAFVWSETVVSWVLTAGAWVVAESYWRRSG